MRDGTTWIEPPPDGRYVYLSDQLRYSVSNPTTKMPAAQWLTSVVNPRILKACPEFTTPLLSFCTKSSRFEDYDEPTGMQDPLRFCTRS